MEFNSNIRSLGLAVLLLATHSTSYAQSNADLAKAAQNPVAKMISLPFQYNINTGIGPDNETQSILNIQPVLPISLNDEWNIVTRTILPIMSQPDTLTDEGRINGLGDTTFTAFLSPAKPDALIWGAGPVFLLPTATDDKLGSDKWGAGVSAVILAMPGHWVIGSLVSNVWSIGGSGNQDVTLFTSSTSLL
ncbi:hypothetical protein [Desulfotalea psychrophila]|uniref:Related to neuromedin U (Partial length) n=1 Tax=Desulfotalea psychrophila (strain LSv54 / DSM 12343) TaxID=177439 RepID=Q6ARU3_DESPS|nr:hypothetical protein [Desulfotalea psychrophila]CAG34932.1 related to neuromedin U precursor (partial length) [Desulfotalea psychrophila LSv54]